MGELRTLHDRDPEIGALRAVHHCTRRGHRRWLRWAALVGGGGALPVVGPPLYWLLQLLRFDGPAGVQEHVGRLLADPGLVGSLVLASLGRVALGGALIAGGAALVWRGRRDRETLLERGELGLRLVRGATRTALPWDRVARVSGAWRIHAKTKHWMWLQLHGRGGEVVTIDESLEDFQTVAGEVASRFPVEGR